MDFAFELDCVANEEAYARSFFSQLHHTCRHGSSPGFCCASMAAARVKAVPYAGMGAAARVKAVPYAATAA